MSIRVWQKCISVHGSVSSWHTNKCSRTTNLHYYKLLLMSEQHITSGERCTTHISRINTEATERLFPLRQRLMWPRYYRPASGIARLLLPDGVSLQEVLDIYRIYRKKTIQGEETAANTTTETTTIKTSSNIEKIDNNNTNSLTTADNSTDGCRSVKKGNPDESNDDDDDEKEWQELHRDFAVDKSLWMRCALADFIHSFISKSPSPSLRPSSQSLHSSAPHNANSQEEETHHLQRYEEEKEEKEEERRLMMLRKFYKYTCRDRTMHDAEIRKLFHLTPYAPPPPPLPPSPSQLPNSTTPLFASFPSRGVITTNTISDSNKNNEEASKTMVKNRNDDDDNSSTHNSTTESEKNPTSNSATMTSKQEEELQCEANYAYYHFTPFAQSQYVAMKPINHVTAPNDRVQCLTFRELHNLLSCRYYSMSALNMLHEISGDEIIPSTELVQTLALYLKERLAAIEQQEKQWEQQQQEMSAKKHTEEPLSVNKQSPCQIEQQEQRLPKVSTTKHYDYNNNKYKEAADAENIQCLHNYHTCNKGKLTFSRETPVVFFFTNGRLPYLINKTKILPFEVQTMERCYNECSDYNQINKGMYNSKDEDNNCNSKRNTGKQENKVTKTSHNVENISLGAITQRRLDLVKAVMRLVQSDEETSVNDFTSKLWSPTFFAHFRVEHQTVQETLMKYKPAIAVVEPHCSQDFLCDIRGFYSMREVLMLGPVDSPAMGSFSSPFLTFGTLPGADSYWVYNAWMKPVEAADSMRYTHTNSTNQHKGQLPLQPLNTHNNRSNTSTTSSSLLLSCNQHLASSLPMLHSEIPSAPHMTNNVIEPPYAQQGYYRQYIDTISSYLISPNDSAEVPNQYRCLSFRRIHHPVI